jgi:hypothetical protein
LSAITASEKKTLIELGVALQSVILRFIASFLYEVIFNSGRRVPTLPRCLFGWRPGRR